MGTVQRKSLPTSDIDIQSFGKEDDLGVFQTQLSDANSLILGRAHPCKKVLRGHRTFDRIYVKCVYKPFNILQLE